MTSTQRTGERGAAPAQATRSYDIVKEFVIAFLAVAVLTVGLSVVFSSPDEKPINIASWANADPADFVATATSELAGTSDSAGYGPPYNTTTGASQRLGPLKLEQWMGVTQPVNSAHDFVLTPLASVPDDAALAAALTAYNAASPAQQQKWATSYADALSKAPGGNPAAVTKGDYGPVPILTGRLLDLARSGGLDSALQSQNGFYSSDYTKSLLFLADSTYMATKADTQHLSGDQWGMMNETGNFPGQAWLWLYTFWYQIKPFSTSDQRRRPRLGPHGPTHPRFHPHPLHSRPSHTSPPPRRLPPHLARALPQPASDTTRVIWAARAGDCVPRPCGELRRGRRSSPHSHRGAACPAGHRPPVAAHRPLVTAHQPAGAVAVGRVGTLSGAVRPGDVRP